MAYFPTRHDRDPYLWDDPRNWRKSSDSLLAEIAPVTRAIRLLSHRYLTHTRSGRPEVVIKVVSGAMGRGAVTNILDYIARDADYMQGEKVLSLETDTGDLLENAEARKRLIEEWGQDFEAPERYRRQAWKQELIKELELERGQLGYKQSRVGLTGKEEKRFEELNLALKTYQYTHEGKTINLRINAPKDTVHLLLSVGGQSHDNAAATEAVRRFLTDTFATMGFNYAFVMHNDTDNLHFHVVIKAKNSLNGEHINFDREDLFNMRQEFTYQLEVMGIQRTATLRQDRVATVESISKQRETLENTLSWYESKLANAQAMDAFGIKGNALKQTERLIGLVKTASGDKEALKAELERLEAHKQNLLTLKPGQFEKERDATLRKLAEEHKKLLEKRPILPDTTRRGFRIRQELNRRAWINRHREKIKETIATLARQQKLLSPAERTKTAESIRMLEELNGALKPKLRL